MNAKILSVLLAEDNPISSKLAEINISKLGHKLDVARNGQEAVEKYITNKYDVILMDIEMPVMNGIDATEEIRKLEKENDEDHPVRIIAMTAHGQDEIRKLKNKGLDEFCVKPYRSSELKRIISR